MFHEMRRKEKQLTEEETVTILREGEYGTLSTVGPEGWPYGVPLNYVWHNGHIYFHAAMQGQKLENIEHEERVAFSVVTRTELMPADFNTKYMSAILFGQAGLVFGTEKEEALMALIAKYSAGFMDQGKDYIEKIKERTNVVKITIEHLTGKGKR